MKEKNSKKQIDFHMANTTLRRDWFVVGIKNGMRCSKGGGIINDLIPNVAIFHTIGMERYDHPDFQLVLNCDMGTACTILNTFGDYVRAGRRFNSEECVSDIFNCDVHIKTFKHNGRNVLRVIIPDGNFINPDEEGCDPGFCFQLLPTEQLYLGYYQTGGGMSERDNQI